MTAQRAQKKGKAPSKKKGGTKKDKDASKPNRVEDQSAALSRILFLLISILVVVAAVLLKPLLDNSGIFEANEEAKVKEDLKEKQTFPDWPPPSAQVGFLVSRACQYIHCHSSLKVSKRHFRATERIEPGEKLFEIPRSMQLWDLDALRDPWIRLHLFEARHRSTGNHVGSEAYLAAYLAVQMVRAKDDTIQINPMQLAYFDVLQPLEHFYEHHPILADSEYMKSVLGLSEGFGVLQAYRSMIFSEYEAFVDISKKFEDLVGQDAYYMARMNVLTRAINVGPPGPDSALNGTFLIEEYSAEQLLYDELQAYKDMLDIDLSADGCRALIPIADLFNHHSNSNVKFEYRSGGESHDGALVVKAEGRRIEEGFEPMASYGTMTDTYLFARYGFVNGDGSAPVQVTVAFHHDILKLSMSSQFQYLPKSGMTTKMRQYTERPLSEYLRFDDGYESCIRGPSTHPEESELKRLKYKHLQRIANMPERWQFSLPSRNPFSHPSTTHETPIIPEPPQYIPFYTVDNFNFTEARATCRLIALITSDFDGKASKILRDNLQNDDFFLSVGNDALEFRSLICVKRLMRAGLASLEKDKLTMRSVFNQLNGTERDVNFGSRDWAARQMRFAEMQALQAVSSMLNQLLSDGWKGVQDDPPPGYKIHHEACPREYVDFLLEDSDADRFKFEL